MRPEQTAPQPHPDPPSDLGARTLPLLTSADPHIRIHPRDRPALHFDRRGVGRFASPDRRFGVLYVAADREAAFVETLGQGTGVRVVTRSALRARALSIVTPTRRLRLVDLTGTGLARIGADARLCTGEHVIARRWSAALHRHPARPDGLVYRARHDPSRRCAALYDRARGALRASLVAGLADDAFAPRLAELLDAYAFGLIEDE